MEIGNDYQEENNLYHNKSEVVILYYLYEYM